MSQQTDQINRDKSRPIWLGFVFQKRPAKDGSGEISSGIFASSAFAAGGLIAMEDIVERRFRSG